MAISNSFDPKSLLIFGLAMAVGSIYFLLVQNRWGVQSAGVPEKYAVFEKQGRLEGFSAVVLNRSGEYAQETMQNRGISFFSDYYRGLGNHESAESWMRYGYESGSPAMLMLYGDYCVKSADPAGWRTASVCYRRVRDAAGKSGFAELAAEADRKFRANEKRRRP